MLLSFADSSAHGTKKMEIEVLQRFELPVPSLEEQRAIAALIAAAVTGQLEVGAAA